MSWVAELSLFLGVMVALLMGGMWVPFAIGTAGLISIYLTDGLIGFRALGLVAWGTVNSFTLSAIPLFILMAEILQASGVSSRFYSGLAVLVQKLPGRLLQTNIAGSAMFAAISGSSVATAAGMGSVALPQLEKGGYDRPLAAGSLAAGGTLGILIPPSIPLIIYGTFTEVSIAKLFAAGLIPGVLLALLFMLYVGVSSLLRPVYAQDAESDTVIDAKTLLSAIISLIPLVVLMVTVLGSIYAGLATPSEAGGLGCFVALIVGPIWGRLGWADLQKAMVRAISVSGGILYIVMMAFVFSYAVENAGLSTALTKAIVGLELGRYGFLVTVILLYCVLGCLLESIAMMVLTVPLLFGAVVSYGFDPLWFGVILVLLLEIGMLTPPFGINLFVIQGVARWPMSQIVRGVVPFWMTIFLFIALITVFPEIVTWFPAQM